MCQGLRDRWQKAFLTKETVDKASPNTSRNNQIKHGFSFSPMSITAPLTKRWYYHTLMIYQLSWVVKSLVILCGPSLVLCNFSKIFTIPRDTEWWNASIKNRWIKLEQDLHGFVCRNSDILGTSSVNVISAWTWQTLIANLAKNGHYNLPYNLHHNDRFLFLYYIQRKGCKDW